MKTGLSMEPHPVDPQITLIRYQWKSEYTGNWITIEANVLDWNPHAAAITLRKFSEGILEQNKLDILERTLK